MVIVIVQRPTLLGNGKTERHELADTIHISSSGVLCVRREERTIATYASGYWIKAEVK